LIRWLPLLALLITAGCTPDDDPSDDEAWPTRPDLRRGAAHVSGQVVSYPEGEPIEGMSVVVFDVQARYEVFTTDASGRYHAAGLVADFYRLKAWPLDGQPWIGAYFDDTYFYCTGTLVDLTGEHSADVDFRLPHGGSIQGTITDAATGEPIEDARIDVQGLDYYNGNLDPTVYTDADGIYEVAGLDSAIESLDDPVPVPGNYQLEVTVTGRPVIYYPGVYSDEDAEAVEAVRNEVNEGVDLAIPTGATVSGTVIGADGEPVASGTVYARHDPDSWIQVSASIRDDGSYELAGLAPGSWDLEVGSLGQATRSASEPVEVAEDELVEGVDHTLTAEGRVDGTVTAGGEPLEGVSVRAIPVDGGPDDSESTDAGGVFSIGTLGDGEHVRHVQASGDTWLSGYPCGDTLCASSADGDTFTVTSEETTDAGTFELPAAGIIEGWAHERETGRSLGRIYVTATPEDGQGSSKLAISDEDGSFRLAPLVPGDYTLLAEPYRYCHGDPGWVTTYSGGARTPTTAATLTVSAGEVTIHDVALPRDLDGDAMADLWEWLHFLDPTRDDSTEDPDLDGVLNIDEYLEGTDPREDLVEGGCDLAGAGDRGTTAAVLAALVLGWLLRRDPRRARPRD